MNKSLLSARLRAFITFFALICLLVGLWQIYYKQTGNFQVKNLSYDKALPVVSDGIPPLSAAEKADLDKILSQPFQYLAKGNQTYVFMSADKKYVLKLFKFSHLQTAWWQNLYLSLPFLDTYRTERAESQQKRLKRVFEGHRVAYLYDKENTGLVYIHLSHTHDLNKIVNLQDGIGRTYALNLDDYIFAVQHAGVTTQALFRQLLDKGDVEAVKKHLDQLFDLYVTEYQQGLLDQDKNLMINTGFIDGKAARLDAGKLTLDPSIKDVDNQKADMKRLLIERVDRWFKKNYPKVQQQMREEMQRKYQDVYGESLTYP